MSNLVVAGSAKPSEPLPTAVPAPAACPTCPAPAANGPHVHPPDVVSFFDPASVGGGGPLKRITTQQRERAEQEARERAARIAAGLPPEEGLLSRFRSGSLSRRPPRPSAIVPLKLDEHEEHHHEGFSPSASQKTLALADTPGLTPGDEKGLDLSVGQAGKPDDTAEPEPHVYPDGGYGWVVVCCCATLAGLTMGWGMNWGVFQTVSTAEVEAFNLS